MKKAVLFALAIAACNKAGAAGQPGTEAGARALLQEFLKPGADRPTLTKQLKPTHADYAAVFSGDDADKAEKAYSALWDSRDAVFEPKEGQTELKLFSASSEDLKAGTGNAREFPGGWAKVGGSLKPGLTFYRWKFVKPGEDLGMAFDGLVHVNGHWAVFPKPWRALGK